MNNLIKKFSFIKTLILALYIAINFFGFGQDLETKRFIKTLCSQEFHGRGYVNNGDNIAADYIAKTFKEIGVSTVNGSYFQNFLFL